MSKIDVQIVSKTDERSTPTVAVRRPKGTSTLGYCCRALFVVLAVWAAIVGAGIYQLVTVTTIEPHTIDVAPSARAPDRVIEISVDAHVKSFPAQFSIKLESARCAVGGGGGDESESESLSLSLDTEGLLVATDSAHFCPPPRSASSRRKRSARTSPRGGRRRAWRRRSIAAPRRRSACSACPSASR